MLVFERGDLLDWASNDYNLGAADFKVRHVRVTAGPYRVGDQVWYTCVLDSEGLAPYSILARDLLPTEWKVTEEIWTRNLDNRLEHEKMIWQAIVDGELSQAPYLKMHQTLVGLVWLKRVRRVQKLTMMAQMHELGIAQKALGKEMRAAMKGFSAFLSSEWAENDEWVDAPSADGA